MAKAKGPLPSPHVPKELVATPRWGLWNDGPEEDIRFIDWGAAFPVGQTVSQEVMPQPIDLRAPETFFIGSLSCKLDLWRAGCVVRIITSFYTLHTHANASLDLQSGSSGAYLWSPL